MKKTKFKNLIKFLENHSPTRYSIILILPIITFITGFFIWNIYLYSLGFILDGIDNLLKTRFILTGILFILITLLLGTIVVKIKNKLFALTKKKKSSHNVLRFTLITLFLFFWFLIYSIGLFPNLPLVIGGGQPKVLGLIINEDNFESSLKTLDIKIVDGGKHQTENLCLAYESPENLIILKETRIILLDRSLINGFVSLPGPNSTIEQDCVLRASFWAFKGFYSGFVLSIFSIYNSFIATLLRQEKFYFNIP